MSKSDSIPKKSLKTEFYVGLFFMIGLSALAYLTFNLAGMRFGNTGFYEVKAEFDSVSGLEKGASVEIAGVPIGDVDSIGLNATSAVVTLRIREEIQLRDDDIAAIRTKGIIGDRFVKIIPGGSEELIAPGSKLTDTESAVEFEEIIGKFIHKME